MIKFKKNFIEEESALIRSFNAYKIINVVSNFENIQAVKIIFYSYMKNFINTYMVNGKVYKGLVLNGAIIL